VQSQSVYKKYFVAVVLEEPVFTEAEQIKQKLFTQFNVKAALRSPAHITLHRPFEYKFEKEEKLITILKQFAVENSIEIELNGFNCFDERVIYIDMKLNNALLQLYNNLRRFMQEKLHLTNEVNQIRAFHPHVTVAFRDLKKKLFTDIWTFLSTTGFEANFQCKGFHLLRLEKKWEVIHYFPFQEK